MFKKMSVFEFLKNIDFKQSYGLLKVGTIFSQNCKDLFVYLVRMVEASSKSVGGFPKRPILINVGMVQN
jgi:hypothetical protein